MNESQNAKIKAAFFLVAGLCLTVLLYSLSNYSHSRQAEMWKAELTRKAVISALAFSASVNGETNLTAELNSLRNSVTEVKEATVFKKAGDKFQITQSTDATIIGETTITDALAQSSGGNTTVPVLETDQSFSSGNSSKSYSVLVYTPLPLPNSTLLVKFSTDDVVLLRAEQERNFLITFATLLIFLILFVLFAAAEIYRGWSLSLIWKDAAKSKDELLSLAAHDLNAPLTAVKASLATISENFAASLPKEVAELIKKTFTSIQGLIDLIEEILTISRFERGKIDIYPRPVNLGVVVKESAVLFQDRIANAGMSLKFEVPDSTPKIVADPEKIKEVVGNLLTNAVKYGKTGPIVVSVTEGEHDLYVHVKDEGEGITENDLPKLFQRFTRLKSTSEEKGHGLGLYICRLIIEAHHGKIWAERGKGRGAVFSFSLPKPKRLPQEELA